MKTFRLGLCVAALVALMGFFASGAAFAQDDGPVPHCPQTVQQS